MIFWLSFIIFEYHLCEDISYISNTKIIIDFKHIDLLPTTVVLYQCFWTWLPWSLIFLQLLFLFCLPFWKPQSAPLRHICNISWVIAIYVLPLNEQTQFWSESIFMISSWGSLALGWNVKKLISVHSVLTLNFVFPSIDCTSWKN